VPAPCRLRSKSPDLGRRAVGFCKVSSTFALRLVAVAGISLFGNALCATIMRMVDSPSPHRPRPADATVRRLEAQHLQALEGNPLTPEEIAMFEMFEREKWPEDRCLAYIRAKFAGQAPASAAE
jgi:hypothetical protein